MKLWSREDAVQLCTEIESACPEFGCHVALTGGLLYKSGPRKDADLLFYRIRSVDEIDVHGLFVMLGNIGVKLARPEDAGHRWCIKAGYKGMALDLLFPDFGGTY